jgi:hypothetical protein
MLHKLLERFDHWLHPLYFGALYAEGHGLYATIGGACGVVALFLAITEEISHAD